MTDSEFTAYQQQTLLLDGRYRYISAIQEGSFGKVTLAFDTVTHTEVALKAMYRLVVETRRMARHEIRMLTRLGSSCENICKLLHHFDTENYVVLVLEYCSQGDLYDLIHQGTSISSVDIWHIAKELAAGVSYAHSKGIYHRDIKPENVLFNACGTVKVCDWGLLTTLPASANFNVGTEKYLAPECFKGTEFATYNTKYADYWSLGITLLTAVFGTAPFKPIGDKSLEMDTNFKNFAIYGKSEVLYDIYPTMNANCFRIFMNLLKVASVDVEPADKQLKISLRSLTGFLADLEANWRFGLTIDEEYELEEDENFADEEGISISKNTDMFAMDHDILDPSSDSLTSATAYDDSIGELLVFGGRKTLRDGLIREDDRLSLRPASVNKQQKLGLDQFDLQMTIMIPDKSGKSYGTLIPSLVALSAGKSWCDLDDEDHLAVMIEGMKNHSLNTINEESPAKKRAQDVIRLLGDLGNELHAY